MIWALDSGRPKLNDSTRALARQGGPKLMGFVGDVLYYHSKPSEYLCSVPTSLLNSPNASTDGMASDSNGLLYTLMPESNAIYIWNTTTGTAEPYVRDARSVYPERAYVSYCDG